MKNSRVRKKAEIILKVRSGAMTVSEAATHLGISRKTYYEWEKKALGGMMQALEDKPPGRKRIPVDSEKEELKKKLEEKEKENTLLRGKLEIRRILAASTSEQGNGEPDAGKKGVRGR
jgi:transposase-like protein